MQYNENEALKCLIVSSADNYRNNFESSTQFKRDTNDKLMVTSFGNRKKTLKKRSCFGE